MNEIIVASSGNWIIAAECTVLQQQLVQQMNYLDTRVRSSSKLMGNSGKQMIFFPENFWHDPNRIESKDMKEHSSIVNTDGESPDWAGPSRPPRTSCGCCSASGSWSWCCLHRTWGCHRAMVVVVTITVLAPAHCFTVDSRYVLSSAVLWLCRVELETKVVEDYAKFYKGT